MKKLDVDEIKKCALDILIEFDTVCQKYNIKYSLFDGTLLGAIRHNGFIPWDDDIDVAMLRSEYNKLLQIGKKYNDNSKIYKFKFPEYEDGYRFPFGKFVDDRTQIEEIGYVCDDLGIYIDIFPLDYISGNNYLEASKNYKKLVFLQRSAKFASINGINFVSFKFGNLIRILFYAYVKLIIYIKSDRYYFFKKLKRKLLSYKGTKFITSGTIHVQYNIVWQSEKLIKYTSHIFENHYFPIFADYDYILSEEYGDYMKLPPESERNYHYVAAYML